MKINRKGLPHEIATFPPSGLEIEKTLDNDKYLCYFTYPEAFKKENPPIKLKINEKENKLIIDGSQGYGANLYLVICGLCILYPLHSTNWNSIGEVIISILLLCIGIPMIIHSLWHPKKIFIFDRLKGTLTCPDLIVRKRTIPFNEVICQRIYQRGPGTTSGKHQGYTLDIINANKLTSSSMLFTDYQTANKCWSFLVWYMDRNRPLPPGNAFTEEHRKQDYERRKSEGFPPPLFPSTITIREDFSNVRSRTRRKRKGERW